MPRSRLRLTTVFLNAATLSLVVQLVELGFHCGVTSGQSFNSDVLSLVVGEAEVAVGAEEGVFGKRKLFLCHSR
jgi:hypothetical protein